ncbi:hypothetical protein [Lysobacter sp. cf310]|uniref:hypothetical protein n=1 Tax=Lysobacter sp. cf310 TaxID=1761790 RepID=UPI0008E9BB2B|nr:hypothetical protein [Lysobacter sp. cf310]SFK53568.1 hypothetical protein SAMN04487938_1274 [Lysobacter sp. cf310]
MRIAFILAMMVSASCNPGDKPQAADQAPYESALIVGSAQSPDPVLARVMELEKSGAVKDVVVQESFPVQIRLRAPRKVIEELQRMPRTGELR